MKKTLVIFLFFLIITNLFCLLPKTKTIGADTLSAIRNACGGNDLLINYYYLDYRGESRDEEETGEDICDESGLRQTFDTATYMKRTFLGVIDTLLINEDPDEYLNESYRFLLVPPPEDEWDYLSIAAVIDTLEKEPEGDAAYGLVDVFSLAYTLNNLAMIVDMLWYYEDGDHQDELADKLDELAIWTYLS